jgi:ribonuclease P protein component
MSNAPAAMRFTFSKQERLNSEKIIARLYESGFVVSKYPLRVTALVLERSEMPEGIVAQAMINASKRKLKKAVHRNRMKRILRELYRHRKHQLYTLLEKEGLGLAVSVIYSGTHVAEFWDLEKSFDKIWRKFFNELQVQLGIYKASRLKDGVDVVGDESSTGSAEGSNSDNLNTGVLITDNLNSRILNTEHLNSEVGSMNPTIPEANEIGGGE